MAYVALVLVLGLGGTLHARLTLSEVVDDELDQRALAVARDLEGRSGELLLTNDLFGLHRGINEAASADDDIRYIVIFDRDGKPRASTFANGLPDGLRSSNWIPFGQEHSLATLQTNEGKVRDVAFGINGGQNGTVRVGFSTAAGDRQVERLTSNLVTLTAIALFGGFVASFWLATVLTRPLARLADAARAVGRGERPELVELYQHPELSETAVAFDAMTSELRDKEAERTMLLGRLMMAQEEERRRISRELHDEAGQALTSVLLGLKRIENSACDERMASEARDLHDMASETLELTRTLARDLRPSSLDDLGLVAALRRFLADYGPRHNLLIDFHAASMDGVRLPADTETALYRIAQEALTNVSRHARARSVNVLLENRPPEVIMVVEDDGIGFESESEARSPARLGLLGMEERASIVGGSVTVESKGGAGTVVFVRVPCGVEP